MLKLFTTTIFILTLTLATAPCAMAGDALPLNSEVTESPESPEPVAGRVEVKVNGQKVRVLNAMGCKFELYSITGSLVHSVEIEANDKTLSLNVPRGWYIVKVGSLTRKIAIKYN